MRAFFKKPLVIATIVALVCGLLRVGQPLDHIYWNSRFKLTHHEAPKSIVIASLSEGASARGLSQDDLARLLGVIAKQAPKHIYIDTPLPDSPDSPFANAIRAQGSKVTVVVRANKRDQFDASAIQLPDAAITGDARVVFSGWYANFLGYAQASPDAVSVNGRNLTAFASDMASSPAKEDAYFIPDFATDPDSVPLVSASQLVFGEVSPTLLTGRTVVINSSPNSSDLVLGYFGHQRVNPVYLDIAGAASLSRGGTYNVGALPLLAAYLALMILGARLSSLHARRAIDLSAAAMLLAGPAIAQLFGFYSVPSMAMIAAMTFSGIQLWTKWRRRVRQTSASGLPNFMALSERHAPAEDIIVATIGRYEEFLATLPSELHGECARQIARRFAVGSDAAEIFHGEGGHFAWLEKPLPSEQSTEHFEGMRALFSAPLLIGGHMFDTNVHFGLDRNYHLDTLTRLNTAMASAGEALKGGRVIEQFEASRLENAPWELSLLARIDEGMKNGDIWVAYQPQWNYRSGTIGSAEALVRWNDPERGPIRPDAFIVQAERAGRIDALTYWVLEEAITAAQMLNTEVPGFQMSINLSALLVDKPSLLSSVSEIVRRRGIDCRQYTFEVTETASVYNRPAAVRNLQQLRAMGFRLAIDDFGTGEASLLYLAELPSDELKIDQHFVSRLLAGERERHIVQSTIRLAHALKQSIVAEGIEDQETFELLRRMGCDIGQGYYIGRPGTFEQLRLACRADRQRGALA